MWTRGRLRHTHTMPVPHVFADNRSRIVGIGGVPLNLPRPVIEMDPSDQKTWTRPVRWTS